MDRRAWTLVMALGAIWGASLPLHRDRAARPRAGRDRVGADRALPPWCSVPVAWRRGELRLPNPNVPLIVVLSAVQVGGALHPDCARSGGDHIVARRDPRGLDAALHCPSRNPPGRRRAVFGLAVLGSDRRTRRSRPAPWRGSERHAFRGARRWGDPAREPRLRDRRLHHQAPLPGLTANWSGGLGDGDLVRSSPPVRDRRALPRRRRHWGPSPRSWRSASSVPGWHSQSSTS